MCLLYALDDGQMHSQNDICLQWEIPRSTLNTIIKQLLELVPPAKQRSKLEELMSG